MFGQLPEQLNPWRSADRGLSLSGLVPLRELSRLRELLLVADGDAAYQIRFARDHRGRALILGSVTADLVVQCQRCLGHLSLPLHSELRLIAVRGLEEVHAVEEPFEPVVVEDGVFRPLELIEEELLLALPHVPLHLETACGAPVQSREDTAALESLAGEPASPFAMLADFKTHTKH